MFPCMNTSLWMYQHLVFSTNFRAPSSVILRTWTLSETEMEMTELKTALRLKKIVLLKKHYMWCIHLKQALKTNSTCRTAFSDATDHLMWFHPAQNLFLLFLCLFYYFFATTMSWNCLFSMSWKKKIPPELLRDESVYILDTLCTKREQQKKQEWNSVVFYI